MKRHTGWHIMCAWHIMMGMLAVPLALPAQVQDTTRRHTLDEVTVSAQRAPSTLRTAAPTQVVDAERISEQGLLQLSDAVKMMAGVTLKDYGGVGGMKTVSARGLGSQFSTVTIDGVAINEAQNGQVDLGRYMLGNTAYVSFSQGQQQETLLSARAYAAGNVLNMETAEPRFFAAERTNLRLGMELGSFGMMSPSALWEHKWNRRLRTSLWANYLKSDGDYPFTLYYTADRRDSSSRQQRQHSAMHLLTADGNLFYTLSPTSTLTAKVHYTRGMNQLPGPVIYYSQRPSGQTSYQDQAFAQAKWRTDRSAWQAQVVGKVRLGTDRYEDTLRHVDDRYTQREAMLGGSLNRQLAPGLTMSLAADGLLSALRSRHTYAMSGHDSVLRADLCAVAALRYQAGPLEAQANLQYSGVRDRVNDIDTATTYSRLNPYLAATYRLGGRTTLRAFYKQTFRIPNFGELYYFQMLPRLLRPELARQVNLGLTHIRANEDGTLGLQATVDGYYNRVSDKIVARPIGNMYYWSMENYGRVDIAGLDVTADLWLHSLTARLNYSFQRAVDHTDPADKRYGYQIPYTPRHSGGGQLRWANRWLNLGASVVVVGHRYYGGQNSWDNRMPAYCDLSLSADREVNLRWGTMQVQVQVLNLLDTQYEVVHSYPMMGRNYRLKIIYNF